MWRVWVREEAYRGFCWENLRDKVPFGRPRRRWEDNIKMVFEMECWVMDWSELAQNRDM